MPEIIPMQCRCPVCGGLTQVPSDLLNYLVRCDACGGLLRPIMAPKENGREALKAEPQIVGRVREMVSSNAGIAELLSPPPTKRRSRSEPPPIPTEPPPLPNELPQISLADMAEMAAVSGAPKNQRRRSAKSGRSFGIITMSVLGAIVFIGSITAIASFSRPKQARAQNADTGPAYLVDPSVYLEKTEKTPSPKNTQNAAAKPEPEKAKSMAKAPPRHEPAPQPAEKEEPFIMGDPQFVPAPNAAQNSGELFPEVNPRSKAKK